MKILIVSTNEHRLQELTRLLRLRSSGDDVEVVAGKLDRLIAMTDMATPDVLLLEQDAIEDADLAQIEVLGMRFHNMAIVLICPQPSPQLLLQAMRAGVREILPAPDGGAGLIPAMRRIEEKCERLAPRSGKVLAFLSCKGGSGATFIAANLAYALAQENKRVALFDLNLQFGDATLFVSDQKPVTTLSTVAQQIHRLDPSFLEASMVRVSPNFSILAAPEDPADANDIKPEHIDQLLQMARRQYDFILLDVGRNLDAVSVCALDQADLIFPVLQATLPYIRDGKRLLGVFRSLDYRSEKIQMLLNRYSKNDDIRLADLETAYGRPIAKTIPNHYDAAAASVNQGVPILKLAPDSTLSQALQAFARDLAGTVAPAAPGWMARVFKRA